MATGFDLGGLSTYTKQVGELFGKSIVPLNLWEAVEVMENVKYKTALNLLSKDLYLQNTVCGPTATGATYLTQRVLEVCEITAFDKFCITDLNQYWTNEKLSRGSNITDLDWFQSYYLEDLANRISHEVQKIAWQGDTDSGVGNLGLCDGFIYLLSGSTSITTGTTALTVSNIVAQINLMILALPAAIAGNPINIYLSNSLYNIFIQGWASAYGAAPYYLDNTKKAHPFYNNINFVPQGGLEGTNYIFMGEKRNFVYGTDIRDEFSTCEVYYHPVDKYIYTTINWKQGVQVKWPDQIVQNFD